MPAPLIVLVDDDAEIRYLLHELLADEGFDVVEATDGPSLMNILQSSWPALILLDVMMSWIDGFALCLALKRNPQYASVPICFLSARTAPDDIRMGTRCGAAAYFCKPIDVNELFAGLRRVLAGAGLRAGEGDAAPAH